MGYGTAMSLAARDRMTFEEFLAIADELPPFAQLIDGEVVVCVPDLRHQIIAAEILRTFTLFAQDDRSHGWMGWAILVRAGEHDGYVPDLWWTPASTPRVESGLPEIPALVIEVRSPSTWSADRGRKLRRYEAQGVGEVWLVDGIDDEVTVHRRSAGSNVFDVVSTLRSGDGLTTPLIPGWTIDLTELLTR